MTTTIGSEEHVERSVVAPPSLLMAMELGKYEWKVGFTTGLGQRPRRRTIHTDHWPRLADEITGRNTGWDWHLTRRSPVATKPGQTGSGCIAI
jgi:hypothetical protein